MSSRASVIEWLLDSDPAIRWQVMRDLTARPRRRLRPSGRGSRRRAAGARLLALQGADGSWAGAAWNHGWDSTMHVLMAVAGDGSRSRERRRRGGRVDLVRDHVTWQGVARRNATATRSSRARSSRASTGRWPRPAPISAKTSGASSTACSPSNWPMAAGTARPRTARRARRSTPRSACSKRCSSTSCASGSSPDVTAARLRGQEYLLERRLFRRLSTGEVIERIARAAATFTQFRLSDVVALRRAARARLSARGGRHPR